MVRLDCEIQLKESTVNYSAYRYVHTLLPLCVRLSPSAPQLFMQVLTWLYAVGYFLRAASVSKLLGSLERMSAATSSSTSSLLLPPDEEERA